MPDATPSADVPAQPPRRFRRLRIFVSVFFAAIAVGLCILWAISCWRSPTIGINLSALPSGLEFILFKMQHGNIGLHFFGESAHVYKTVFSFEPMYWATSGIQSLIGFRYYPLGHGRYTAIFFPAWVPIVASIAMTWIMRELPLRTQFSLRTLLIGTTLTALIMGLVGYIFR
jgi:hypothetical protein